MNKNKILINLIGAFTCFLLFCVGMLYSEKIALLTLAGIIGLSGFSYFIFRIVHNMSNSRTSD
ncbi:hypothetical protein C1N55_01170 [Lysinibacillus sp. SGAir0095]|nr:hypothetical protein C1N55_01170 [Lysinibacillus sp. SGAir0095]